MSVLHPAGEALSMFTLLSMFAPGIIGSSMLWYSGRCKGKNGRAFVRYAGWGFLLLYVRLFYFLIPLPLGLNYLAALAPSAICFVLAANALIREMRAQKNGEFTEAV